jgi:hypothetical protein
MDITITLKNSGTLIGTADVSINTEEFGYMVVKSFQIWKSQVYNTRLKSHANITPPSIKKGNTYFKLTYFEDNLGWERLESQIWNEYLNQLSNSKE